MAKQQGVKKEEEGIGAKISQFFGSFMKPTTPPPPAQGKKQGVVQQKQGQQIKKQGVVQQQVGSKKLGQQQQKVPKIAPQEKTVLTQQINKKRDQLVKGGENPEELHLKMLKVINGALDKIQQQKNNKQPVVAAS